MSKDVEQTTDHAVESSTTPLLSSPSEYRSQWNTINWKRAEQHVRRLQERIYRVTKRRQWKQVRNLQKLLARSYHNKLLAIREVTERNKGKKTAGVDGKFYSSSSEKWQASQTDFNYRYFRPQPVRRVYIPKSDGSQRPLGIPTIDDRIMQTIIKTALEPEWEARFEPHSYGFRPGRCTMDAIAEIRSRLGWTTTHVWVLDADISKCFDNIAHPPLLNQLPVFKLIIERWLKAGVIDFGQYFETDSGIPQGGTISPLLANIALTGIERLFNRQKVKLYVVRYADDFVVISPSKTVLERYVIPQLQIFLSRRGLNLNQIKTRIVHRTQGFTFLGFSIQYFANRSKPMLLVRPSKQNISKVVRKIKTLFQLNSHLPLIEVMPKINRVIRGWTNYYQFVNAKTSFALLNHKIRRIIWFGLKRLHPQKSIKWLVNRYFRKDSRQLWNLRVETEGKSVTLLNPIYVAIRKYAKVMPSASPFDSSQRKYWQNRSTSIS